MALLCPSFNEPETLDQLKCVAHLVGPVLLKYRVDQTLDAGLEPDPRAVPVCAVAKLPHHESGTSVARAGVQE